MMKHIWKQALALLLACGMAAGAAGCGENERIRRKALRQRAAQRILPIP